MAEEQKSLNQIIQHRKEKLKKLIKNGVNPFPYKFEPSHKSLEIINNFNTLEGKSIKIAGRLMAIRKMGKASFAQILDQNGKIQIFIKENKAIIIIKILTCWTLEISLVFLVKFSKLRQMKYP